MLDEFYTLRHWSRDGVPELGAPRGPGAAGRGRDDGGEWTIIERALDDAGHHRAPCLFRGIASRGR